jgi:hypothetical protein
MSVADVILNLLASSPQSLYQILQEVRCQCSAIPSDSIAQRDLIVHCLIDLKFNGQIADHENEGQYHYTLTP